MVAQHLLYEAVVGGNDREKVKLGLGGGQRVQGKLGGGLDGLQSKLGGEQQLQGGGVLLFTPSEGDRKRRLGWGSKWQAQPEAKVGVGGDGFPGC